MKDNRQFLLYKSIYSFRTKEITIILTSLFLCVYFKELIPIQFITLYTNSLFPLILFISIYILQKKSSIIFDNRLTILSSILGIIFSLFMVLGSRLYFSGYINYFSVNIILGIISNAIFFSLLMKVLTYFILKGNNTDNTIPKKSLVYPKYLKNSKIFWFICFIFILTIWSIYWLSYYPGIVDIDSTYEFWMFTNNSYQTHHPILHVLLFSNIVDFGYRFFSDYNIGVSIYIWIQMIYCSLVFTLLLKYIQKKYNLNRFFVIFSVLFWAIFPVIPMNIITSTKDAIFTSSFIVFIFLNFELINEGKAFIKSFKKVLLYVVFGFLTIQFRNNSYYAYLFFSILLTFHFIKKKSYKPIVLIFILLVIDFSFDLNISNVYKIEDVDSTREMMSVPLQQIARTYSIDETSFNYKEKELIFGLVGKENLENYHPYWADFVKYYFNQDFYISNFKELENLYVNKFTSHLTIYLDSFLLNTLYSWYPNAINDPRVSSNGIEALNTSTSMISITNVNYPANLDSKIPLLYDYLQKINTTSYVYNFPILSQMFSIGALFWLFLYSGMLIIYRKNWNLLNVYIFVFIYTTTLWFGPVMFIRYFLFFWYLFPLMITYIFDKRKLN